MNENSGSQVVARAASILRVLENHPEGINISSLSRETQLPRATVHRLVMSLESELLVSVTRDGVKLGLGITRMAASAHTDLLALSRLPIETLGRRTRETVDLCVYRGSHAVSVSQYMSDQELRVMSPVGTAFPCHCTAHGKAMLAKFSNEQIESLIGSSPDVRTENTHSSLHSLIDELEESRLVGYFFDKEEHAHGVCGLGVPINTGYRDHYALSIAVPALRFEEKLPLLIISIMQCQAEIEAMLDGN